MYRGDPAFEAALDGVTFKDLNGKHYTFAGADGKGPSNRALALHVSVGSTKARRSYVDCYC